MFEDDHQLLERALRGDEPSFTALYRRRQAQVYRFAFHMTGSESASEDVTQETFLAVLKTGARFDANRGTVVSFLYGIARNQVHRFFEKRSRERQNPGDWSAASEDGFANVADDVPAHTASALDDLTQREMIEEVRRAVVSLPPQYREAVVLCDLEDTSYEDAAAIVGCPVGTIRSRLSRGRELLAQKLQASRTVGSRERVKGVAR